MGMTIEVKATIGGGFTFGPAKTVEIVEVQFGVPFNKMNIDYVSDHFLTMIQTFGNTPRFKEKRSIHPQKNNRIGGIYSSIQLANAHQI